MSRLVDRFAAELEEIGAGALRRELDRELPFGPVETLRAAGIGAVRLPVAAGGAGASFSELVELLVALGRADANLPQLLRGHVGFVELVLTPPPLGPAAGRRAVWVERIASGALVGNAQSERGTAPLWRSATTVDRATDGWTVTGEKYYTTGTLFADWVYTSGRHGEDPAVALVPTAHVGVERRDDWDGFGQRLTGSGTTVLRAVPVDEDDVAVAPRHLLGPSSQAAVFQTVLLATLAGIGQRALDDAVEAVRTRPRAAFTALVPVPAEDPQVQQVVGELAGRSLAAVATVREAALAVERLQAREHLGTADAEAYAEADATVFAAQGVVVDLVLGLTSDLFRVGGASLTARTRGLDRHWRNARTIASHNPEIHRARIVGEHLLGGRRPAESAKRAREVAVGS